MGNVVSIFNNGKENYFRIKVDNPESEFFMKKFLPFIFRLTLVNHLESESEVVSAVYKDWIGHHNFLQNREFTLHIIFEQKHVHLILHSSLSFREKFANALIETFGVAKPKK